MRNLLVLMAALAATFAVKGAMEPEPLVLRAEGLYNLAPIAERAPAMTDQEMLDFIANVLYLDVEGIDADVLSMPTIEAAVYPGWGNVLGWYYPGDDTVYVSEWFVNQYGWDSYEVREVILHESTHYIDFRYRGSAYDLHGEAFQWSEENAWHVGNTWWVHNGHGENAAYNWFTWYGFDEARPVTPWDPRK